MSLATPLDAESRTAVEASAFAAVPWALAFATLALCAFAPGVLNDGDTFSHVATGEWSLDHRAVPHADPFSSTFAGAPWIAHEWLAEVGLALAYRAAGWGGVMLLTGATAALAVFVVARHAMLRLAGPAGLALTLVSVALIAPHLLARPHILALPCLAVWSAELLRARETGKPPPLALALVMGLWANLHGGFAFGLALLPLFALDGLRRAGRDDRLAAAQGWLLLAYASLIAALATPFGFEGLSFPLQLLGNSELARIGEWLPADFSRPRPLELFLVGLIAFALTKPLRLDGFAVALLAVLVHLALQHSRHETLLAVLAPMLLARPAAAALKTGLEARPASRRAALAFGVAALSVGAARLWLPAPALDMASAPVAALAAIPEAIRAKPVLNAYRFGGYLIFAKVRPFIDGRADMYGPEFLQSYGRIAAGDPKALAQAVERHEIGWTLFPPDASVVAVLDRTPGWRRIYADGRAVAHARDRVGEVGLRGD